MGRRLLAVVVLALAVVLTWGLLRPYPYIGTGTLLPWSEGRDPNVPYASRFGWFGFLYVHDCKYDGRFTGHELVWRDSGAILTIVSLVVVWSATGYGVTRITRRRA